MTLGPELRFVDREYVALNGSRLLYLAGIDYHRMSSHPAVVKRAAEAAMTFGLNATGSRATTGNHSLYRELEDAASRFFGCDAAVVLPSGYMSNTVLVQAIERDFGAFFLDDASHSSLFDAIGQFDKPLVRFEHLDAMSLKEQLTRHLPANTRPLVLTDGVFPARGEMPPLKTYSDIVSEYGGKIVIDDAHGMAVTGPTGKGTWEALDIDRGTILQTGTLSKGFGVAGGIIPADSALAQQIYEKSLAFIGCTGLALPLAAAAIESISHLRSNRHLIAGLQKRSLALKHRFMDLGFVMPDAPTPIFSITFDDEKKNRRLEQILLKNGIYPPFIHYPGSPQGGHFRFILTSATTEEQETLLFETIKSSL